MNCQSTVQAWLRLKKSTISNIENKKVSSVLRNIVSVWSKFLHSGWKTLRLTNQYDTRHFFNGLFSRCLILILWKQKKSSKHGLTPKNLITVSFNTKKACLSIIYYWQIYEISWIMVGYHLKSKNSLKRDNTEKYHSSSFKSN